MYELIEHRRLDSAASSIEFSNIPQDGSDLLVVGSFRFDRATRDTPVRMLLNGAGFTARNLFGYPTSVGSQSPTTNYIGWAPGATSTANIFGNFSVLISNYTATGAKSFSVDIIQEDNQAGAFLTITAGLSSTTAAITTVAFSDEAIGANLVAGSSATLYKVNRRAGIGRAPLAMGGYMSYSNGYWVHTFPSSGSFIPFTNMEVEYLVIAGGAAGGAGWNAGGGGAGGYVEGTTSLTASVNYPIAVGAGGTGAQANSFGANGSNSIFSIVTANGGGGGAMGNGTTANGANGGSGGGGTNSGMSGTASGGSSTQTSPAGGTGYGNRGGNVVSGFNGSGAGGGAGGPGSDTSGNGAGGAGLVSSITGTAITRAGGGGSSSPAGAGGSGGGGAGNQTTSDGGDGTANTGSGGGGRGQPGARGGNGGSGIVIVRYRA